MRKILIVAEREFRAIVGTKAFVLSVALMPIMMFGSFIAMEAINRSHSVDDKTIVVIDHSGQFGMAIEQSANQNNSTVDFLVEQEKNETEAADSDTDKDDTDKDDAAEKLAGLKNASRYHIERMETTDIDDEKRLALSDRVRQKEIYAFMEIPADIMDEEADAEIKVYSEDTGLSSFVGWVRRTINERAKAIRFIEIGLDPDEVRRATSPLSITGLGLLEAKADGEIQKAVEKDELTSILLPLVCLMLMFMVIFMSAQPMLESVLEEKSQRIAEVLLGSANPSQLMAGKLLGSVAGSLLVVVIYLSGAVGLAYARDLQDRIPFHILPWFFAFQVLGVMLYSAIFMAVGASVSQLKEAQSMLLPVWMLLMSPLFIWFNVIQEPNGGLATWFSLFPPATPGMMVLRMATGATIPWWQPVLGLVLLILATWACVFVAGRIFRVGILWQGKTPKIGELFRWAATG